MARSWEIRSKDGSTIRCVVHKLTYEGEWMEERYVTADVSSPTPIDFEIGDYLIYRGERFELNNIPSVVKKSRANTNGEAFRYEEVKLDSYAGELAMCRFLDVVPSDNNIHYTQLPIFSFYAENVNALAERLQANLDRVYYTEAEDGTKTGLWSVSVHQECKGEEGVSISVNDISCSEALALCYNEFDVTFTISGRNIVIGAPAVIAPRLLKYGKGNGLKQLTRSADTDSSVITRLYAYGSTKNLPSNYYAKFGEPTICGRVTGIYIDGRYDPASGASAFAFSLGFDPGWENGAPIKFSVNKYDGSDPVIFDGSDSYGKTKYVQGSDYPFRIAVSAILAGGEYYTGAVEDWVREMPDRVPFEVGALVTFIKIGDTYYDTSNIPWSYLLPVDDIIPNNLSVNRLMLPGFPEETLTPHIDSENIATLGVREGSAIFDGSGDLDEIYPTLEGMTAADLEAAGYTLSLASGDNGNLDEIAAATNPTDVGDPNYVTEDEDELNAEFSVVIKDLGFDITLNSDGDSAILMKDGMCGSREFKIVNAERVNVDTNGGLWLVTLERVLDDTLQLYFPNVNYQIKAGDHFALTGIYMPKVYVDAASQRLLTAAKELLADNDYTRQLLEPEIDDIFIQRQHDNHVALDEESLYETLREGIVLGIDDDNLEINAQLHIAHITITEGDEPIPHFEITLKERKYVGTIDSIKQQIDNISGSIGNGKGGGLSRTEVEQLITQSGRSQFLSKTYSDETPHALTIGKGVQFGPSFAEGMTGHGGKIDGEGNAWLESLSVRRFLEVPELRYNRTSVEVGNAWNAPGGGVIESVTPDLNEDGTTALTGTATLRLEEGEIGAIAVDDICMGIFHDIGDGASNATADSDDGMGGFHFAGFTTVYFRVTAITDTSGLNATFTYALRSGDDWTGTAHPYEQMSFVAYGNFTDTARQCSAYHTRTYERMLSGVNTWKLQASNVAMQMGDLSNLAVFGAEYEMTGYSIYLANLYVKGTLNQMGDQTPRMEVDTGGDGVMIMGETLTAQCSVWMGWLDVTSEATEWSVTRDTADAEADATWNASAKAQAFDGTLAIEYSSDVNDIGDGGVPAIFTFTATINGQSVQSSIRVRPATTGVRYWLEAEAAVIPANADGTMKQDRFVIKLFCQSGNSAAEDITYTERTRIRVSRDGETRKVSYTACVNSATNSGWPISNAKVIPSSYIDIEWASNDGSGNTASLRIPVVKDGAQGETGAEGAAGADGTNGVTYQLTADASSIYLSADGTTTTPQRLIARVLKAEGTAAEEDITQFEQYRLSVTIDGGSSATYYDLGGMTDTLENVGVDVTSARSSVTLLWENAAMGSRTLVIPVVKDGTNGADGADGTSIELVAEAASVNTNGTATTPERVVVRLIRRTGTSTEEDLTYTERGNIQYRIDSGNWISYSSLVSESINDGFPTAGAQTRVQARWTGTDGTTRTLELPVTHDGADGAQGEKGEPGCVWRITEWAEGVEYRNDSAEGVTDDEGMKYVDVVALRVSATSFVKYMCKATHVSTADNKPPTDGTETTYWRRLNDLAPTYIPLLLTDTAVMTLAQANAVQVVYNNQVVAAMGGGTYPLRAGTNSASGDAEEAAFRVNMDGKLFATGAELSGTFVATYNGMSLTIAEGARGFIYVEPEGSTDESERIMEFSYSASKNNQPTLTLRYVVGDVTQESVYAYDGIYTARISKDKNGIPVVDYDAYVNPGHIQVARGYHTLDVVANTAGTHFNAWDGNNDAQARMGVDGNGVPSTRLTATIDSVQRNVQLGIRANGTALLDLENIPTRADDVEVGEIYAGYEEREAVNGYYRTLRIKTR